MEKIGCYQDEVDIDAEELTTDMVENVVPVRYCKIYYNDISIYRPIKREMLRDYVCKSNF